MACRGGGVGPCEDSGSQTFQDNSLVIRAPPRTGARSEGFLHDMLSLQLRSSQQASVRDHGYQTFLRCEEVQAGQGIRPRVLGSRVIDEGEIKAVKEEGPSAWLGLSLLAELRHSRFWWSIQTKMGRLAPASQCLHPSNGSLIAKSL